jgi:hypothetical protein
VSTTIAFIIIRIRSTDLRYVVSEFAELHLVRIKSIPLTMYTANVITLPYPLSGHEPWNDDVFV